jgi:ribosomal protein L21E
MIEVGKRVKVTHVVEPEKWWEHAEYVGKVGRVVGDRLDGEVWDVDFDDGNWSWGFRTEELEVVDED